MTVRELDLSRQGYPESYMTAQNVKNGSNSKKEIDNDKKDSSDIQNPVANY